MRKGEADNIYSHDLAEWVAHLEDLGDPGKPDSLHVRFPHYPMLVAAAAIATEIAALTEAVLELTKEIQK